MVRRLLAIFRAFSALGMNMSTTCSFWPFYISIYLLSFQKFCVLFSAAEFNDSIGPLYILQYLRKIQCSNNSKNIALGSSLFGNT